MAKKRDRSFVEPPIQRRHFGYGTAVHLVQSGVNRFHRIERVEGLGNLPDPHEPTIIVGNHQNGLMDAIVQSAMLSPNQIHFLTRADVFYQKTARALLFAFNQMPIYRQRDKLSDARERNQRIFEICAERLNIGATVGLFPEGNHRAVKTLRPLRRGVVDMVNSELKLNPEMKHLKLVPVGIDYEQMTDLRRRLSYRVGEPVPFEDLIDPDTGEIPPGRLLERLKDAMDELLVNIQPESHYEVLLPYVQAMRTTETEDWIATRDEIRGFQSFGEEALESIGQAHAEAAAAGVFSDARPKTSDTALRSCVALPGGSGRLRRSQQSVGHALTRSPNSSAPKPTSGLKIRASRAPSKSLSACSCFPFTCSSSRGRWHGSHPENGADGRLLRPTYSISSEADSPAGGTACTSIGKENAALKRSTQVQQNSQLGLRTSPP